MCLPTPGRQIDGEGRQNDASARKRSEMMLKIAPSTAVFLDLLLSESKQKRILESGTSQSPWAASDGSLQRNVHATTTTLATSPKRITVRVRQPHQTWA